MQCLWGVSAAIFAIFAAGPGWAASPSRQPPLLAANVAPSAGASMSEGVARIAVKASQPQTGATDLRNDDRLTLYVLLCLRGETARRP